MILGAIFRNNWRARAALWILLTSLFVLPFLARTGTNVVTKTYANAAQILFARSEMGKAASETPSFDPYRAIAPESDVYKYSPMFGAGYWIFSKLPNRAQSVAWGFFNLFVFWCGLFFLAHQFEANLSGVSGKAFFVAALLSSFELDGSLRYQQINAALVGVMMIGLGALLAGSPRISASLFALGFNVKLLPLFWVPALTLGRWRSWALPWLGASVIFWVLLPAMIWGVTSSIHLNVAWLRLLVSDASAPGLLDLGTLLQNRGLGPLSILGIRAWIGFVAVLLSAWWLHPTRLRVSADLGLSIGLCALLLLSPRTESPTFVFLSPVYFFIGLRVWREKTQLPRAYGGFLFVSALALATLGFHDLWPREIRLPYSFKVLGTLVMFVFLTLEGVLEWNRLRLRFQRQ